MGMGRSWWMCRDGDGARRGRLVRQALLPAANGSQQAVRERQPRIRLYCLRSRRVGSATKQHSIHQGAGAGIFWHGMIFLHNDSK